MTKVKFEERDRESKNTTVIPGFYFMERRTKNHSKLLMGIKSRILDLKDVHYNAVFGAGYDDPTINTGGVSSRITQRLENIIFLASASMTN